MDTRIRIKKFKKHCEEVISEVRTHIGRRFTQQAVRALRLTVMIVSVIFLVGYMVLVNTTVKNGYDMATLESRLAEEHEEHDMLKLEIAQMQSAARIRNRISQLELVSVSKVTYYSSDASLVLSE